MKKYHTIIILLLFFTFTLPACCKHHIPGVPTYSIWVHSDIQPVHKADRWHYKRAIEDLKNIHPYPMIAIIAGDIVQHKTSDEDFEWFLEVRKLANIQYWYEIAGNHEWKNMSGYQKYIGKPLKYTVSFGNVLFIFMSNERGRPPTYLSNETFNWWKNIVISNQDKIIITITHAPLQNSKLLGSFSKKHMILDSWRFEKVLKKYHVDIWVSGHIHMPAWLRQNSRIAPEFGNILFINVCGIRKDPTTNVESRIFFFQEGSDKVLIRLRDHESEAFKSSYDINITLRHPFTCNGCVPSMLQENLNNKL
ncbi:MAG: metallophosphoesterase [Spirochaetes bacterium]|nr:metallophosphoesterase [Spirochaetota bacterium]